MAENKEELKSLLMGVNEKSEKPNLKLNIQNTKIIASIPITSWQIDRETRKQQQTLFWGAPKSLWTVTTTRKLKDSCSLEKKAMTNLDSILKSRDTTLPTKVCIVKAMICPVVIYGCELDHKEGWVLKNWCFWIVVLEKTLESPLESKEIKSVNPKGNQPWIFIGRTDAEPEAPTFWSPKIKIWLIGQDLKAGQDWEQEEKGMTGLDGCGGFTSSTDMSFFVFVFVFF